MTVEAAIARGREAISTREHFDGYKANPDYAIEAACAGSTTAACLLRKFGDTANGGTLPHEIEVIVGERWRAVAGQLSRHPRP